MKRTVWTFGLISGAIVSLLMLAAMPFHDAIGYDRALVIGYTSMVVAFLLVYFGIRSYRDNIGGGTISLGRAMAIGTLITLVASTCYTVTWEIYFNLSPGFSEKYAAHMVEQARASGASQARIDATAAEGKKFVEMYKNPLINSAMTFIEPLPVGLLIALVSAGILSRRRRSEQVLATT
jgi:Protein of unknown function (DUF4199)